MGHDHREEPRCLNPRTGSVMARFERICNFSLTARSKSNVTPTSEAPRRSPIGLFSSRNWNPDGVPKKEEEPARRTVVKGSAFEKLKKKTDQLGPDKLKPDYSIHFTQEEPVRISSSTRWDEAWPKLQTSSGDTDDVLNWGWPVGWEARHWGGLRAQQAEPQP